MRSADQSRDSIAQLPSEQEVRAKASARVHGRQGPQTYIVFWGKLAELARERPDHPFTIRPRRGYYTGANYRVQGVDLNYVILRDRARVHLFIHRGGVDGRSQNREIFDRIARHREEVEADFGDKLDWVTPGTRGSNDAYGVQGWILDKGGLDQDNWDGVQHAMVDAMIRLEKALRPYIGELGI